MSEWVSLLVSWLPFLILLGVWWVLGRWWIKRNGSAMDLMRESIELQKKTNVCLEEIKTELKRR